MSGLKLLQYSGPLLASLVQVLLLLFHTFPTQDSNGAPTTNIGLLPLWYPLH